MEPPHSICGREGRAIPRGVPLWLWLAGLIWIAAAPAWAAGGIYAFTDARGVTHFTNRPHDKRYKPVRLRDPVSAPKYRDSAPSSRAYDLVIGDAAASEGIPPALVKAVIAAES